MYDSWQMIGAIVGTAGAAGATGWLIGQRGWLERCLWTQCVFYGNPPPGYTSWQSFLGGSLKSKVFVRAATAEDWLGPNV